jgi:lipopolysaccharide heptosyltransferase II
MIGPDGIKKILVIKLRAIGDVLLSTIVLKNLRRHFPDAQIDFLTEPASREVLGGNTSVDNVVIFDRANDGPVAFLWSLRRRHYDLVIDLFGNPRTALMTYLSGARHRVGYEFRGRRYAYSILVHPRGGEVHNTEFNLDALRTIGIEIDDHEIPFSISKAEEDYAEDFVREKRLNGELVVALNPSGSWYTKRWGLSKFAMLGDQLVEQDKAKVLLLWGPGELEDARRIQGMMRFAAIISPKTSLKQLGALLKRCSLVVSNDAGPMHLAAILGVPTLGIYGPTNPRFQGPVGKKASWVQLEGLECLGCNLTSCAIGHLCMEHLSVDAVMEAVHRMLEKEKKTTPARIYA